MGFEPMNTGFADQRVSHFAIGAHAVRDAIFRRRGTSHGGAILTPVARSCADTASLF